MLHFRCAPCSIPLRGTRDKDFLFCVLRSLFCVHKTPDYFLLGWARILLAPSVRFLSEACRALAFPASFPKASASCLSPETRPLSVPLPKCYRALAEKQRAYLRLEPHHVMRERCTRLSLSAEKQPQTQTSAGHTTVSEKPCPTKNRQHSLLFKGSFQSPKNNPVTKKNRDFFCDVLVKNL